jgi:hypothetical protein
MSISSWVAIFRSSLPFLYADETSLIALISFRYWSTFSFSAMICFWVCSMMSAVVSFHVSRRSSVVVWVAAISLRKRLTSATAPPSMVWIRRTTSVMAAA